MVKRLLPETLGGLVDTIPILDTGEAVVVGDAPLLPSKIRVAAPENCPRSGTIDFWDEWAGGLADTDVSGAVEAWRMQGLVRS